MLEFLSIFEIEVIFLNVDIQNYTMQQRSIHCIIMVFMWAFFIGVLLLFSRKHYHFPKRGSKRDKISLKNWIVTLACFIGCKIMTFIDWHTLKIIGEAQNKTVFQYFVSRGVGLEIWNGISTMIFSVLSGVMYLRLNRKCLYSYLFIAIGYLL